MKHRSPSLLLVLLLLAGAIIIAIIATHIAKLNEYITANEPNAFDAQISWDEKSLLSQLGIHFSQADGAYVITRGTQSTVLHPGTITTIGEVLRSQKIRSDNMGNFMDPSGITMSASQVWEIILKSLPAEPTGNGTNQISTPAMQ